ncbi:hypothetical protein MES4922_30457 [Mesorhizobium ventifaucium]|uniref:Uncharacterized protein n=1 Tax=Mesorhizobium ventifaucium TaxID=666020 RepID=A0ABN8JWJ7_9HYPH|nr:hypothetical protein MES4922_30457 [Mesorhizobium ventifaucium]
MKNCRLSETECPANRENSAAAKNKRRTIQQLARMLPIKLLYIPRRLRSLSSARLSLIQKNACPLVVKIWPALPCKITPRWLEPSKEVYSVVTVRGRLRQ